MVKIDKNLKFFYGKSLQRSKSLSSPRPPMLMTRMLHSNVDAQVFITKPFDKQGLLQIVNEFI
jgi:hypothetical protein